MAYQGPLPAGDSEFDILQEIIVKAVQNHAAEWDIPAIVLNKLVTAQTPWTDTWAIAKDKQNSTTAQKKRKDVARKNYSKVLRPFIQKWVYRNENMDAANVEKCGLRPRKTAGVSSAKTGATNVTVKRGATGELITRCAAITGAKYYGCIITEGGPLPACIMLTDDGRLIFNAAKFDPEKNKVMSVQTDLNPQRVKHFVGLKDGSRYYIYFYVVNSAGISTLSEPVSIVCW